MKGLKFSLVFLGCSEGQSKKGNDYLLAKFIEPASKDTFEFFVMNKDLMKEVKKLKEFIPTACIFDISAYQGQARINLVGVKQ